MEVQGKTAGGSQRVVSKHAKVLQFMCQQHAGIKYLAEIKTFFGEKRPRSQTCFLRQSSFSRVQQKINQSINQSIGKKRHELSVFHCQVIFVIKTPADLFSSVIFNHVGKLQEIQPLSSIFFRIFLK